MKTTPKTGIVVCCVAALSGVILYAQHQKLDTRLNKDCTTWVKNCLRDFETIKVGMTRGEIMSRFRMDGGLQPAASPIRFVHPACRYFKIDVAFDFKRNTWGKDDDKAIKVSKPYIEKPIWH